MPAAHSSACARHAAAARDTEDDLQNHRGHHDCALIKTKDGQLLLKLRRFSRTRARTQRSGTRNRHFKHSVRLRVRRGSLVAAEGRAVALTVDFLSSRGDFFLVLFLVVVLVVECPREDDDEQVWLRPQAAL